MIITSPDPKVTLYDDYDFLFTNGAFLPLSLDKAAGDSVDVSNDNLIMVRLTARPSVTDPSVLLPPEEITIFTKHILSIQHRVRKSVDLTVEQKNEWQRTLQEMRGTIQ